MRIAFIGLGNMGAPMARNLIKAGHQLNLFDLNKAVLAELAELGGQISPSPKDAAANSELVITMLPAATHVRSVYLNEDGVLAGIRPMCPRPQRPRAWTWAMRRCPVAPAARRQAP
ncbi:hypothetical protein HBJ16_004919 [Pseudomonas sp. CES]|nr:hypothetical protein HBJ16_004919 [Pseudomonas sp. CES]